MQIRQLTVLLVLGLAAFLATGCTGTASLPEAGQAALLDVAPEGAVGVVDLKSNLITGLAAGESVLEGRVGGGENETWDPDQAAFLVRDLNLKTEAHDHGDTGHDNCKFCQAAKAQELESMALVRIVDENGKVIATDARKLLGLQEDHIVLAVGEGAIEDGTLVFNATKVFIRP